MSKTDKTEHSGPKKGSGAYYGRKAEAKKQSNRKRREQDKVRGYPSVSTSNPGCLWKRKGLERYPLTALHC